MDDPARTLSTQDLLAEAGWLRRLARRLTASADDALELEQDTWRAALERPPRGAARPWLQAVATNLWKRRRRDAFARRYHEERAAAPEAGERGGEAELATLPRLELQARVVAAVRALREPLRTAVTLRHLDGLGYDEVARRTGTSEVAARKRVSRGLDELRARLDRAYGGRAAWGVLAFALGRDLPVPSSVAIAATGAVAAGVTGASAAGLLAGGVTMTAGTKIGLVAGMGAIVAGGLFWLSRDSARSAEQEGGARGPQTPALVGVEDAAALQRGDAPTSARTALAASEPEATPAPPADERLHGRVVDPTGAPVADADVVLLRIAGQDFETLDLEFEHAERRLGATRTDADGRFSFAGESTEAGRRYALRASGPPLAHTLAPATVWASAGPPVEIALASGGAVSGQVVRPDEQPAIGARLVLRTTGSGRLGRTLARSDAGGGFRFDGLAPGGYRLEVSSDEGATPGWRALVVEAGRERQLLIRLERGWELTGRVTDAVTGRPVAGARVSESWVFEKWVTTDADGRFLYRDYPREGYVDLEVDAEGYGRRSLEVRSMFGSGPVADRFEIALVPAATVAGRIVAPDGGGLADAYVACAASVFDEAGHQHTSWRAARTDSGGRFVVANVASDLATALFVAREGSGTLALEIGVPVGAVELGDVVLAPGAVIRGRVVDAAGAPLEGLKVVLRGACAERFTRFDGGENVHLDSYVAERETVSDVRGRFAFHDVAPGEYRVTTTLRGLRTGAEVAAPVAESERGGVVDVGALVLLAGLAIEGRVLGPDGNGAGAVFVNAWGGDEHASGSVLSETDGAFRVVGLGPGLYQVEFAPAMQVGGRSLARTTLVDVVAGSSGHEVRLAAAASLTGRVVDAAGAPVAGATVKMALTGLPDAPGGWTETDRDGRFSFEPPEGARVDLSAHPPLAERKGDRPFQHDEDPARAAHSSGVDAAAGAVTLVLPAIE
jgi:RNA polymerase sigma-70 factor (ECF subfamily)